MPAEIIQNYFEQDLSVEDERLLLDLVKSDPQAARDFADRAAAVYNSFDLPQPAWPAGGAQPNFRRKGEHLLWILGGGVFVIICVAVLYFAISGMDRKPEGWERHEIPASAPAMTAPRPAPKPEKPAVEIKKKTDPRPVRVTYGPIVKVIQRTDQLVQLRLLDKGERLVRDMFAGHLEAGDWIFEFDGLDMESRLVDPGEYIVEIKRGDVSETWKMLLSAADVDRLSRKHSE